MDSAEHSFGIPRWKCRKQEAGRLTFPAHSHRGRALKLPAHLLAVSQIQRLEEQSLAGPSVIELMHLDAKASTAAMLGRCCSERPAANRSPAVLCPSQTPGLFPPSTLLTGPVRSKVTEQLGTAGLRSRDPTAVSRWQAGQLSKCLARQQQL